MPKTQQLTAEGFHLVSLAGTYNVPPLLSLLRSMATRWKPLLTPTRDPPPRSGYYHSHAARSSQTLLPKLLPGKQRSEWQLKVERAIGGQANMESRVSPSIHTILTKRRRMRKALPAAAGGGPRWMSSSEVQSWAGRQTMLAVMTESQAEESITGLRRDGLSWCPPLMDTGIGIDAHLIMMSLNRRSHFEYLLPSLTMTLCLCRQTQTQLMRSCPLKRDR